MRAEILKLFLRELHEKILVQIVFCMPTEDLP